MGLWQWLKAWFVCPPEPTAARVPQAGGAFGKNSAVFDAQGVIPLRTDVTGLGGTLIWQVGAEICYNPKDGPQVVKLALYRDEQCLVESLDYDINAIRPALTIALATEDKIGIGRYRYTLRVVVVRGSWAHLHRCWMTWIERRP